MATASYDVVVVGAGAAGLAAGRAARESGLSAVVLESADRIGGRAWTDTDTFGVPWDRGCHWLHSADINPMRELADRYGHVYQREQPEWRVYRHGRELIGDALSSAAADTERIYGVMLEAGRRGEDRPASEFFAAEDPGAAGFTLSVRAEWGFDPPRISSLDAARYRDTDNNWPLKDGYGALVQRHHRNEPVELSTPVTKVEWGGAGAFPVRVHTPNGAIQAARVLVTVSTGILASDAIAFVPELPDWKRAAIDAVPLGRDNKAAIQLRGGVPGVGGSLSASIPFGNGAFSAQIHPFGTDLVGAYIGGTLAEQLEEMADRDAMAAVVDALVDVFGSELRSRVVKGAITAWGRDPHAQGAYSAARPGLAHLRPDLVIPIDDRIYFAGEATSPDFFSTCHGAHLSGIAALAAMRSVGDV